MLLVEEVENLGDLEHIGQGFGARDARPPRLAVRLEQVVEALVRQLADDDEVARDEFDALDRQEERVA